MSDHWDRDRRPLVTVVLEVVIVALLAAGVAGAAVYHHSRTPAAPVTPAGLQRVVDGNDHVSLAVPAGWRVRVMPAESLGAQLRDVAATDPQLAALSGLASNDVKNPRLGVYAIDPATRIQLLTIGFDASGVGGVSEIPVANVTGPLVRAGATHIVTSRIHLMVGDAEQVTNELTVAALTLSESVFYFVRRSRVVEVILVAPGTDTPISLLRQIEALVAGA